MIAKTTPAMTVHDADPRAKVTPVSCLAGNDLSAVTANVAIRRTSCLRRRSRQLDRTGYWLHFAEANVSSQVKKSPETADLNATGGDTTKEGTAHGVRGLRC
jgi:hypothetical protein